MARRRRNPKHDRLTPGEQGELAARKEGIGYFTQQMTEELIDNRGLFNAIIEGRQSEMSWVQIRKSLRKVVNNIITYAKHKMR